MTESMFRFCAPNQAALDAFHPGLLMIEPAKTLTPAERLAIAEQALLDYAVERSLDGEGDARDLALMIVALRAELHG